MLESSAPQTAQMPVQYAHQQPLTTEGLARLTRLFILLASVELPESSLENSRHEEADHNTNTDPS